MTKNNVLWFSFLLSAILMFGCSKKEEQPAEQPAQPAAAARTPVDQSTVGTITGTVKFEGTKPILAVLKMDQDPVCVSKHSSPVHVEDGAVNDNGTLPNVFVYVKEGADKYAFATPSESVTLDQNGCMYKPHVLGVMAGQTLKVISSDATTHNVHPQPNINQDWNESQAPGTAPIEKTFARSEIMIPVKCNQHPWMRAYIGVTKNPLYAVTGSDGKFTIQGVPPGDYTVEAWWAIRPAVVGLSPSTGFSGIANVPTPLGQTQDQQVTVGPKESKTVDFSFKG